MRLAIRLLANDTSATMTNCPLSNQEAAINKHSAEWPKLASCSFSAAATAADRESALW